MNTKICRVCDLEKDIEQFPFKGSKKYPTQRDTRCKTCTNKYRDEKRKKNPKKENNRQKSRYLKMKERLGEEEFRSKMLGQTIKTQYGITIEDFNNMLLKQNNKCGICKQSLDKHLLGKFPNIDHCHKTKIVRGILCRECNTGLGMFLDNPSYLIEAANYLNKTKS